MMMAGQSLRSCGIKPVWILATVPTEHWFVSDLPFDFNTASRSPPVERLRRMVRCVRFSERLSSQLSVEWKTGFEHVTLLLGK
jgi:hypothetical protein